MKLTFAKSELPNSSHVKKEQSDGLRASNALAKKATGHKSEEIRVATNAGKGMDIMKQQKIEISHRFTKGPQRVQWTERMTGYRILQPGTKVYHYSDEKIQGFMPTKTCFFDEQIDIEGYVYCCRILNPVKAEEYDNEVRIDLEKNINDVEIFYIGQIKKELTGKTVPLYRHGIFTGYGPEYKIVKNLDIS